MSDKFLASYNKLSKAAVVSCIHDETVEKNMNK